MARKRNPKRDEAYQMYADSGGNIKLADIAGKLEVPDVRVRKWKSVDKWDKKIRERSNSVNGNVPFRDNKGKFTDGNKAAVGHGAPINNKNSVGHRSSVPAGNQNAVTHGFYSRFIPVDEIEILESAPGAGELERDLKLARYKLARLLKYQQERGMEGIVVTGEGSEKIVLQDDFYEPLIQKQLKLIADLEVKIHKMAEDNKTDTDESVNITISRKKERD